MTTIPKTLWATGGMASANPARKTTRVITSRVDPAALTICDDPIPAHRASPGCKYADVFSSLKAGQALKCPSADTNRVANALRKYVDERPGTMAAYKVRSIGNYGDGLGRVWLLKPDAPTKAASKPRAVK